MAETYDAKQYWQERLTTNFNLKGVGHVSYTEEYNRWLYRKKQLCLEAALEGVSLGGKEVLDIGCGTGFFVKWYLGHGANVFGVDITDMSIHTLAMRYPQCAFATADIGSEQFVPPREFDVINAWDVIYHIVDNEAFEMCLKNIQRSSKPRSLLLLTDQLAGAADVSPAPHVQFRCLSTYQRYLPDLGFNLLALRPLYFYLSDQTRPQSEQLAAEYFAIENERKLFARNNLALGVWQRG